MDEQEIMNDPYIAADGFTYEGEAIKGWLDSGHSTSPMTNLKLEHSLLVPNRALRSAICTAVPIKKEAMIPPSRVQYSLQFNSILHQVRLCFCLLTGVL